MARSETTMESCERGSCARLMPSKKADRTKAGLISNRLRPLRSRRRTLAFRLTMRSGQTRGPAGALLKAVSSKSASSSTSLCHCIAWSFVSMKRTANGRRSSSFVGRLNQADRQQKLCANNGTSALKAPRRRLSGIRSIWTPSQFWNSQSDLTCTGRKQLPHSPRGAWAEAAAASTAPECSVLAVFSSGIHMPQPPRLAIVLKAERDDERVFGHGAVVRPLRTPISTRR